MTEVIFLGWDRPLLPAAARLLVDRCAGPEGEEVEMDAALVVVPAGRAGRRLRELLVAAVEGTGRVLVPPAITTVGGLPERLYRPRRPPADDVLSRRAWSRALRELPDDRLRTVFPDPPAEDDLAGWGLLAALVHRLHREVGREGLRFRDVAERCRGAGLAFDDHGRWEVLASAADRHAELLAEAGRSDRERERMRALARGAVTPEREIWLLGVAELPGIVRRMLEAVSGPVRAVVHAPEARADAFDALGCPRTEAWTDAPVPLDDDAVRVADRPGDQASEVARALAGFGDAYAPDEVVVGVPDDEVVPHVEQRLEAAGVAHRYAAGTPLPRTAPYRLLEGVSDYLDGRRFLRLASVLRHPDLEGRLDHPAPLETADRFFADHLPDSLEGPLPGAVRDRAGVTRLLGGLEGSELLGRLRGRQGGPRPLGDWMEPILELLLDVYGPREPSRARPADRRLLEALEAIRDGAERLHGLPDPLNPTCPAATAVRLLLSEVRDAHVPPEGDRAAVELLGWLELHVDDAPALVLTGFNDPHLPEAVNADPFLPDALRSHLGLVDNARRYARDAYYLTAIVRSREVVRMVAGRRDGAGDPLRPSRLLFTGAGEDLARRVLRFYGGESAAGSGSLPPGLEPGEATAFGAPPEPVIEGRPPELRIPVTAFGRILQDPYRYALEHVLGLEEVDDRARELDGRGFGSLAHAVLERFGRSPERGSPDPEEVRRRLGSLLDDVAEERYGLDPLPAVTLQVEQLRSRLAGFARWHARRVEDGWRTVGVELSTPEGGVPLAVDGERVFLTGRIDRVDHHAERGIWAVLDYKSSETAADPDDRHRASGGDEGREWVDLQLPLYRHLLPHITDADGNAVVPEDRLDDVRLGYVNLSKDAGAVGAALAEWGPEELARADEAAREAARTVLRGVFEFDPDRATFYRDDPLAALLGRGQLVEPGAGRDEP